MDKEMDLVLVRIFYTGAKDLDHFIFGYMKEEILDDAALTGKSRNE